MIIWARYVIVAEIFILAALSWDTLYALSVCVSVAGLARRLSAHLFHTLCILTVVIALWHGSLDFTAVVHLCNIIVVPIVACDVFLHCMVMHALVCVPPVFRLPTWLFYIGSLC